MTETERRQDVRTMYIRRAVDGRGSLGKNGNVGLSRTRLLILVFLFVVLAHVVVAEDSRTIALVQFEVRETVYESWDAFEGEINRIMANVQRSAHSRGTPVLVVFPEYINVPILFAPYADAVRSEPTVKAALASIGESSLPALVERRATEAYSRIVTLWSGIARANGTAILAGTAFAPESRDGETAIRNRALLFDARGNLAYTQDKVYLTPFEKETLALQAGPIAAAGTFSVAGLPSRLTICRDAFFSTWDERLEDAAIWIDIRANGEPYSPLVRERFRGALPERVTNTAAAIGVDASLTGAYLDLLWAGHAFVVDEHGRRVAETPKPTGTAILFADIPHNN